MKHYYYYYYGNTGQAAEAERAPKIIQLHICRITPS